MPALLLRPQTNQDALTQARYLSDPNAAWKEWDAPYFHEEARLGAATPLKGTNERVIDVGGEAVGLVTRYPERPARGGWWELGILIYDPQHWSGGLGSQALREWTALTFEETGAHVLTLTTWSGNLRMLRLAAKLGYSECARVREARLWRAQRYDSVRFELLRRDWEESLKVSACAPL